MTSTAPSRAWGTVTREWLAPAALFAAAAAWLFRRLLFGGHTLMDIDFPSIHVPFRTFTATALGSGQLPLWVPLQFGLPYLANGDTAVLYPFQLPFLLMDPARAVGPLLWLHSVLTMLSMYAFLRFALRAGRGAGCAGAIVFALSGFFLVHLGLLGLGYAQPWVPLLMLGLYKAVERSLRWSILGGERLP